VRPNLSPRFPPHNGDILEYGGSAQLYLFMNTDMKMSAIHAAGLSGPGDSQHRQEVQAKPRLLAPVIFTQGTVSKLPPCREPLPALGIQCPKPTRPMLWWTWNPRCVGVSCFLGPECRRFPKAGDGLGPW
jgi:hypothetical protein